MEETVAPEESGQVTEQVNPLAFDAGSLPEGLRAEPSLQTFDSVDKLAKSYVNAVKKSVVIQLDLSVYHKRVNHGIASITKWEDPKHQTVTILVMILIMN